MASDLVNFAMDQQLVNKVVGFLLAQHGDDVVVHIVYPPFGHFLKIELTNTAPYPAESRACVFGLEECRMWIRRGISGAQKNVASIPDLEEDLKWLRN